MKLLLTFLDKYFKKSVGSKSPEKYTNLAITGICKLFYLGYLIDFYKMISAAQHNAVSKNDFNEKFNAAGSTVSRHLSDSFASFRKMKGQGCICSTKSLM
jgi:hypothetical protein